MSSSAAFFTRWISFAAMWTALLAPAAAPAAEIKVGSTLPKLELTREKGGAVPYSQVAGKKLTLLTLWASWCAPCLVEMPGIIELWKSYREKGFEVIAINEDEDPKTGIPAAMEKVKMPFDLFVDPEEKIAKTLGASGYPFTLILDGKGKILLKETRERDWNSAEMRKKIEGWIGKAK